MIKPSRHVLERRSTTNSGHLTASKWKMRLTVVLSSYSKLPKNYSNFPQRYVKKQTAFVEWQPPKLPNYQRKVIRFRKHAYYDMYRSWTSEFQTMNAVHVFQPKIYVEPIRLFYIFRGDRVEILTGKDQGKQGIVNYVVKERNWVTVTGLNVQFKIESRTQDCPGIAIPEERPLLVPRDVALVDPNDQKPTKIEWRYDEEGNRVRVSVRSGRIIPLPSLAFETIDFKRPELYVEQPKDTPANDMKQTTFVAKVKTFEMDIMGEMDVKDDRIPYRFYWY